MPGAQRSKNAMRVQLPPWEYLGGETIAMDGTPKALLLPSEASIVVIDAEDGKVYYSINGVLADQNSYGYIPADGGRVIGPLSNLARVAIWGMVGGGAIAHIQYNREV